ncbi:hypothetical protein GCM10007890_48510 [Methylobacterium tardum]|uniref:Uncharacterized protein n=1 Tax=Methylobacterium tardum TaxID=374432 RepID=A0AA37WTQ6_9HYPH|nr:hypothetical protein GCM10007890_48510 [Methylobacterium tardum]
MRPGIRSPCPTGRSVYDLRTTSVAFSIRAKTAITYTYFGQAPTAEQSPMRSAIANPEAPLRAELAVTSRHRPIPMGAAERPSR